MKRPGILSARVIAEVLMLLVFTVTASAAEALPQTAEGDPNSRANFERLLAAAEKGDAKAQYAVGLALYNEDTTQDISTPHNVAEFLKGQQELLDRQHARNAKAAKWYRKAADQGYAPAQNILGDLYLWGDGVPEDHELGLRYFRMAAEQGDSCAQRNLANQYLHGKFVPTDKVQAYKWLTLSARSENDDKARKEEIESEVAELEGTMRAPQIALAKRFVREFRAEKQQTTVADENGQRDSEPLRGSGSGFFVSEDGRLITNFHVVEGASRIVVSAKQGKFPAKVVSFDSANDIAILKLSGSGFSALAIVPSRSVKLGDSVFTIGFPNPQLQGVEPKLTDGKVSSLAGARDDPRYFQISVAVQPGNSGGALVNSAGSVVGIVTARLSDKVALETSGELAQNVNYAIKSSYALSLLEAVPGKLREPWAAGERKFQDVVKEVQEAAALVLAY